MTKYISESILYNYLIYIYHYVSLILDMISILHCTDLYWEYFSYSVNPYKILIKHEYLFDLHQNINNRQRFLILTVV